MRHPPQPFQYPIRTTGNHVMPPAALCQARPVTLTFRNRHPLSDEQVRNTPMEEDQHPDYLRPLVDLRVFFVSIGTEP